MTAIPRSKPILPWWQLGLLLAACGIGIVFLLPDDPGLIEDLLRDGKTAEARRQFDRVSPAARERAPQRYRLLEIRLRRRELPANDPAALAAYWAHAVGAWRDADFAESFFLELRPMIARLRDPAAAWPVIAPVLSGAPAKQQARVVEEFTRAALAAGQPATAAEAFAAGHTGPGRPETDALELARLWQLAGNAGAALAALGDGSTSAINERRIALLRALNRSREALPLLRARLEAMPPPAPDLIALEELATVALQAGQPAEAVPAFRRFTQANPGDPAGWRRLRDLLVTAGRPKEAVEPAHRAVVASPSSADDRRELGRILEWSGEPALAFEVWLELGLQGDLPAIDRLVALNPGLYRDGDLQRALERVVPVADHPEYTLRLARLEVSLGRYDQATAHFTAYLGPTPGEATVMAELARLLMETNRFTEAETWLRRAAALRPADLTLRREIADVLVLQGRHNEALGLYAELAERSPTAEMIDPYTRLAESLGRYNELVKGLRSRIAHAETPTARDYLMLAYAYELGDRAAERRATLEEGLTRLAASDELRLQLASAYAAETNYARAQAVLAPHSHLREEPAAAALYLEVMRLNQDTAAQRTFLATPLPPAVTGDEGVRERLAYTREALRDYAEAERLWRELHAERPTDPERVADLTRVLLLQRKTADARALLAPLLQKPTTQILRLAAEVAQSAGDHATAERYQVAYLAAQRTAPATDWSALGDIRLSRGDRTGAKRAYAEALRRMQAQLVSKGGPP